MRLEQIQGELALLTRIAHVLQLCHAMRVPPVNPAYR